MKSARRWLVAALASAAVHAGGAGALWALRSEPQPIEPLKVASSVEPLQVALFTVSNAAASAPAPEGRTAQPARVGASAKASPHRAPQQDPPPAPSAPGTVAALAEAPTAPSPEPTSEARAPTASPLDAAAAAAAAQGTGAGSAASPEAGIGTGMGMKGTGTGSAGSATAGDGQRAEDLGPLTEALRRSAERCYPAAAARYRLTGTASISFCVEPGGTPSSLRLDRTSGHALLDRAAVSCVVQGAAPLQVAPGCFTLPVAFRPGR